MSSERSVTLRAKNLRVAYDNFVALDCDHLEVEGNVIAVLGHNGAGKSALIKAVLGLLPPSRGDLSLVEHRDGTDQLLVPEDHMVFCPETGSVFADISVESYIKLWCRFKHRDANYFKKGGARAIELLSLGPLLHKLGRELSKGQRRRVQTAIGFLLEPRLFCFDEPFDGLDVQKTHELAEIISEHAGRMSFLVSSHRMDVIERLADLLIVLRDGRVASVGGIESVCQELSGRTLSFDAPEEERDMVTDLRKAFPAALVNRIGHRIAITGHELDPRDISAFLEQPALLERFEVERPSLVDAMNYHLKTLP